ncbi:MAG TPA: hypothetical protein VE621_18280 [Bryobacteraceae bacterium]|nr:hypothetical protein [Bryobacteraceae bacterium]
MKLWCLLLTCGCLWGQTLVPQAECLQVDKLAAADKQIALDILADALESEALYTLATPDKPVSVGFRYVFGPEGSPETEAQLTSWRRAVAGLRCGSDLEWWVAPMGPAYRGKRFVHVWVARRSGVRRVMSENLDFFGNLQIDQTIGTPRLLATVDQAGSEVAFRGLGLLLGHPAAAVEYGEQQRKWQKTGLRMPQGSMAIPTAGARPFAWSWAQPIGAVATERVKALETRAKGVLEEYKKRKAEFIGEGKPGPAALLLAWWCTEKGCRLPD